MRRPTPIGFDMMASRRQDPVDPNGALFVGTVAVLSGIGALFAHYDKVRETT